VLAAISSVVRAKGIVKRRPASFSAILLNSVYLNYLTSKIRRLNASSRLRDREALICSVIPERITLRHIRWSFICFPWFSSSVFGKVASMSRTEIQMADDVRRPLGKL
jgi:hypothetical protein